MAFGVIANDPVIGQMDWTGRQLHFVGIGGAGMSGLALIANALGAQVTGSDQAESSYTGRLRAGGLGPSCVLGGELQSTGSNAGWGSGEWIVVEADESDRSLLKLWPQVALLTSAELDHHATYSSRMDLEETLGTFMGRSQE